MKTRILSAVVLIPLLFLLTLFLPEEVAAVVFGLLLAIGVYELLYRTRLVRRGRLVIYSAIAAFAVTIWSFFDSQHAYLMLGLLVYCLLMFTEMMADHIKVHFEIVCTCFFAGFVMPYLLSALIRILVLPIGRYLILAPFTIAFMSDAGAYFVGIRFGKHKLAPVVSPNKTIEGALGGIASAMVGMLIYAIILDLFFKLDVSYGLALLYGAFGSIAGVFGDLCFSVIKRQTGIKDYGNLIPGHGGVMDRFDSMMTVAPLVEALLLIAPFAKV